ncbi:hypothetical protein [Nocardia jiangxiensis]|uniref:hypothetical protein n=1 Tax=Nocardia jiangxiensis TaxID=282685 RepID=UPI0012F62921|nr:hypothetical protein [Nocardia jiangxiensis]
MTSHPRVLALIGSAVTIAVVVVVVLLDHHDSHGSNSAQPAVPVPQPTTSAAPGSSQFGLPSVDMFGNRLETPPNPAGVVVPQAPALPDLRTRPDYLSSSPVGVRWESGWGGAALGFSSSDGPARILDGVASGYADTPQGAGLAAYDALGRALAASDGVWQRVVAQRYVGAGPALVQRLVQSRANTSHVAKYIVVPDGFRVLAGYRPDFAVVQIAVRATAGWAYSTWPMAWVDGDWKVRVPNDPADLWDSTHLDSLTGFGAWK